MRDSINKNDILTLPENSHNLILRRADWRFLTSNPRPSKSICFTNGTLAQAVGLISDTLVWGSNDMSNDCDLAVGVNPNQKILEAALLALKPGGCCYFEWNVFPYIRPKSIQKKLEEAGFKEVKLFLPKPDPSVSPAQIWIPLDEPTAINFFIMSSYKEKAQSALKRIGIVLRYLIWLLLPKVVITYPFFLCSIMRQFTISSIAYRPLNGDPNHQYIKKEANQHAESKSDTKVYINYLNEIGFNYIGSDYNIKSKTIPTLMLTQGRNILNKIIFLLFHGENCEPFLVVKLPRTKDSVSALANEVSILKTLEDRFENVYGVPKVIFYNQKHEFIISGETFISGRPISTLINRNNFRDIALGATSWLVELARKTNAKLPDNWLESYIEPLEMSLASSLELVLDLELMLRTKEILATLELPYLVCEHRDFCPINLRINTKGEIGVIDWEGSKFNGIPGLDLIYFLINLSLLIENTPTPHSLRECYSIMLMPYTFTGKIFHECLTYYVEKVGIPHSSIHKLCLTTFLLHSCLELQVLIRNQGDSTNPTLLRTNKFFTLWEEELLFFNQK